MSRTLLRFVFCFLLTIPAFAANYGYDLQGRQIKDIARPDTRLVVLIFVASDCPISNRYIPEIARLDRKFTAQQVTFWWVFPNPGDTASLVREHERDFSMEGASGETILDTEQRLVRMSRVTATPEAAIFKVKGAGLQEVYRGRVDDRYLTLGKERPAATQHDLEDAITSALNYRAVAQPFSPPVGCAIVPLNAVK